MNIVNSNIKSNESPYKERYNNEKDEEKVFPEYVLSINADDTSIEVIQLSYIQTHTEESKIEED